MFQLLIEHVSLCSFNNMLLVTCSATAAFNDSFSKLLTDHVKYICLKVSTKEATRKNILFKFPFYEAQIKSRK